MRKQIIIKISGGQLDLIREADARLKIVHWFFAYPTTPVSLSDLTTNLSISKTTANKIVTSLVQEDFLKKEVIGKVWRITCNMQHPYNLFIKVPYNLNLVYQSGIFQEVIKRFPNSKTVILFGSYRKGDDAEKSDVDIAVELVEDSPLEIFRLGIVNHLGYRKNVPVNLHIFSRNKIDLNLFANIANGIVLSGFLEVKP